MKQAQQEAGLLEQLLSSTSIQKSEGLSVSTDKKQLPVDWAVWQVQQDAMYAKSENIWCLCGAASNKSARMLNFIPWGDAKRRMSKLLEDQKRINKQKRNDAKLYPMRRCQEEDAKTRGAKKDVIPWGDAKRIKDQKRILSHKKMQHTGPDGIV